ncbi:twin-arginine translocase subunit TatC [Haloferax larsenii]|uniref:Sec-independent protein translocase protein (TatC) n=1 Tax=Haloferax larsenii TaxID=302484 RepID=A0A1H7QN69_HALLR|nr:twin-arginine translocase subunit TatC [Haloferax larsenii]SEL49491.1 Sec-independent protein translocase protein (TatC) [Haloferax larsenii]
MDATETGESFDPRGRGLSPLAATLRCRAPDVAVSSLVASAVVFALVSGPGYLSPTAELGREVLGASSDLLVRGELAALVGVFTGGAHLVSLTGRDSSVSLRTAVPHLVAAAALFVAGVGLAWLTTPTLVDILAGADRLALSDRQAVLELELFFPVAVGLGAAIPPLLVGLVRANALWSRLGGRTSGVALLFIVAFAAFFSPPDPTTFALYAAPPLAGVAVAVAWVDFR